MKISKNGNKPEIFHSIQGEGKSSGNPSIFVRTSLCNLHCFWCDTDYTWNWENTDFRHKNDNSKGYSKFKKENQIINLSPLEIVNIIREFNCKNIVLTGGEPLIQQHSLVKLMLELKKIDSDYFFEIETNGTIVPTDNFDNLINQYNVSPKLSNSKMGSGIRIKKEPLQFFSKSPKSNFKFVVSSKEDLVEIEEIVKLFEICPSKVYLMSEGSFSDTLVEKDRWLVEVCKERNFKFTSRLHVFIWGSKRGI